MAFNATDDFLRFSAYSIKELITRKLSEDTKFTDQIYEGSNLAILIDIVSYMYQCLIYNLNTAAAESMFSDTQIYQNISRLCKFIGYHPAGFKPATVTLYLNSADIPENGIIPCTAVNTGMYDSDSNPIYFSTIYEPILNGSEVKKSSGASTSVSFVNGIWRLYSTSFTASGVPYETFILDNLKSDSSQNAYIANNGIEVFIEDANDNKIYHWNRDPYELFIQAFDTTQYAATADGQSGAVNGSADSVPFGRLYSNNDRCYTCYLNENKQWEIKFGNGIVGKKLNNGDTIYVMYLDTNGPDGYIDFSQMPNLQNVKMEFEHSPSTFGMSDKLYSDIFNTQDDDINSFQAKATWGTNSLTTPKREQNVTDIRENAPNWFKSGNRLITKQDYEYFLKNTSASTRASYAGIIDAKCMNNWDYLTTFYRWLYNLGQQHSGNPYEYLTKARLSQYGYQYVDSADANNIYLWIAKNDGQDFESLKNSLNNDIKAIKTMTSETYPLKPIDMYFDLSFTPEELFKEGLAANNGNSSFDASNSYLEVTIADNSIYSTTQVMNSIEQVFDVMFDPNNCVLGQIVNYSDILDQIYAINGIERVRTVYYPDGYPDVSTYSEYSTRACDGIAFATWSSTDLIDVGVDLEINNTTRSLEQFQFPKLSPGFNLKKKVKIIKKSMNTTNPVKF